LTTTTTTALGYNNSEYETQIVFQMAMFEQATSYATIENTNKRSN